MSKYTAIIFDCFGVFYIDPVFAYMHGAGTPPEKAEALHALDKQAAVGNLSKAEFICKASSLLDKPAGEIERQFFQGAGRNQELLDFSQKARKKYKIALLSNIGGDMMDSFFTGAELRQYFDEAILSGNVKLAKPDPAIFQLTLDKLGVKASETIFIDDSENHIKGAQKLGIQSIRFLSNEQVKKALADLGVEW